MDDRISFSGQVRVYTGKCFRLFRTEKQWKNLISTAIILLIICMVTGNDMFVTFKDTKNGAFAVICACIWIGLFNSIRSVCRERDIIKREHRTGLRISSYICAHLLYEEALCFAEALITVLFVIIRNAGHLPPKGLVLGLFPDLLLTFFFAIYAADVLAVLVSCSVRDENSAMTVMPFVLIIQLVMSGTVFELEGLSEMISRLTVSKWSLNAVCAIANTNSAVEAGSWISGMNGVNPEAGTLLKTWLLLLIFAAIYAGLSILVLSFVDNDKR